MAGIPPYFIPPPTQNLWVPYPGTKRKADYDCEFGPVPKIFAADTSVDVVDSSFKSGGALELYNANTIHNVDTFNGSGDHMRPPSTPEDDEMKDVPSRENDKQLEQGRFPNAQDYSTSNHFNCAGATPLSFDGRMMKNDDDDDGDDDDDDVGYGKHKHVDWKNVKTCSSELNNSPKLYLIEGLREVLLRQPNADLMLERVMKKEQEEASTSSSKDARTTSKAVVLWQPLVVTGSFQSSTTVDQDRENVQTDQQVIKGEDENEMEVLSS